MKKDKKILKSVTLVSAALLTGSLATFASTNANLLDYSSMGSGSEVRTEILDMNAPNILDSESSYKFAEAKCGEGKCGEGKKKEGEAKKAVTKEGKAAEAKCGEGKCGEGEKKEGEAKKAVTKEGKAAEAKCGEGKCG